MVSPNLTRKSTNTLTANTSVRRLFQVIYSEQNKEDNKNDNVARIKVSDMISKMAFYYEKIRNSVDYQEEYLLRKNSIERILKRKIKIEGVIKVSNSEEIAENLLLELIRAGYLPNNQVPEKKIKEVGKIIEKYIKLKNYSLARIRPGTQLKNGNVSKATDQFQEKSKLTNWLIALMASEIEEVLGIEREKQAILANMHEYLTEHIELPIDLPYAKDLEIQIYVGIYRNFLKFDRDMQSFILFKYYNSNWSDPKDEDIAKIAQNVSAIREATDFQLDHPLTKQLNKIIGRFAIYNIILADVIRQNPSDVYEKIKQDPKSFPRLIKRVCEQRYSSIKSKLWRAAVRSIIYIFLTKSVFVILLEVPAIKWFGEELNIMALIINVVFPALLLFLIVLFTRVPGEDNTARIVEGIEEISFVEHQKNDRIILKKPSKRSGGMGFLFGVLYSITFFLSFGAVVWVLSKGGFNWVSITIFLFFLAFVSFFGLRIRKGTKELFVIEPKENAISFLIDFFYVPIVLAGKWLSERVSRVNVFVFALDFIIEAPFKVFVEVAEQWTKYVKERKDDLN